MALKWRWRVTPIEHSQNHRSPLIRYLRNIAALLITLSGIAQIAALWLRQLNELAVIDALIGAVYLIIGIGLFGQSRFTLFMAMVTPAAAAAYFASTYPGTSQLYIARIAVDGIVICSSALVLWSVRKNPSV